MTICWFGIYNSDFGRNKIYIEALKKAEHIIIECRDNSRGLIKYFYLWKKHRKIKNDYDVMVVGYPGHIVAPFAKLISKKKVIVDALGSLYDAETNSHNPTFFKKMKSRLTDRLMVKFADKILLESEAQKKFFEEKFGKNDKYEVVYTGANDIFNDANMQMMRTRLAVGQVKRMDANEGNRKFVVLFRGKLTPESGIIHILEAAEILKEDGRISFKIIGAGYFLEKVKNFISEKKLANVELISRFLPFEELVEEIRNADLMLGQFADNPRLNRAIPHKAFEALAMGIPYLTGRSGAIKEVAEDNSMALFVSLADPIALAEKIKYLSVQPELLKKIAVQAQRVFHDKFSSIPLAEKLLRIMLQSS